MAKNHGTGDPELGASLGGKLTQDALTEEEIDELRENGQGFERSAAGIRSDEQQRTEPGAAAQQPGRMLAGSGENLGGRGLQVRGESPDERVNDDAGELVLHGDSGDEVERLAQGEAPSEDVRSYRTWPEHELADPISRSYEHSDKAADYRRLNAQEGHENVYPARTADESLTEQYRATNKGTSEGEPSQRDEDFGERGLHTTGSVFDNANKPSILDPDED